MAAASSSETETQQNKILILKTSDGDEFEIEESIAVQSGTIKNIVEDDFSLIPLPSVDTKTLIKIIEYMKKHAEKTDSNEEEIKEFDKEFVKLSYKDLFELVSAANYLHISGLIDLLCQSIADRIKDKSVTAIRKILNITNDYTPEEEAKGFKKIGLQKWEYGNYWFQQGKKHLLSNIKRRSKNLMNVRKEFNRESCYYYGVEEEMRCQRDVNDTLKLEFEKLKERQDDMVNGIASLKEYLEKSEAESRKLLCFLAKTVKQVAAKRDVEVRGVITSKRSGEEDATESSKSSGKKKMG